MPDLLQVLAFSCGKMERSQGRQGSLGRPCPRILVSLAPYGRSSMADPSDIRVFLSFQQPIYPFSLASRDCAIIQHAIRRFFLVDSPDQVVTDTERSASDQAPCTSLSKLSSCSDNRCFCRIKYKIPFHHSVIYPRKGWECCDIISHNGRAGSSSVRIRSQR